MPEGAVILDSAIPQKAMGLAIEQQERLRKEAMARKAAEDKAKADAADDFAKAKAQALKPLENPNEAYLYAANKALENDINAVTLDPTLKTQAEKEKRMAKIATRRHILNEGLKARIASDKELMAKSLLADPNLDMTKLEKDYNASLGKSYIAGLNAPDGMPVGDVDFNTFLENNYTKYLLGTTPVKNAVEKMKREAKTEKYINRLGGSNDWTVQLSDLAKVNFDENKDPIIKYPFEEVPLSSGVKVKTFPKTTEDAFISNQGKSFLKAKESQVEKAIDDNKSLLYTNLDSPLRGKTKKEYDALSKEDKDIVNRYLDYYIIKGYDNSYVRKVEKKDIPANKITVNVNNGRGGGLGGGGGQNAIPDFDQLLEHKFSENGAKITQERVVDNFDNVEDENVIAKQLEVLKSNPAQYERREAANNIDKTIRKNIAGILPPQEVENVFAKMNWLRGGDTKDENGNIVKREARDYTQTRADSREFSKLIDQYTTGEENRKLHEQLIKEYGVNYSGIVGQKEALQNDPNRGTLSDYELMGYHILEDLDPEMAQTYGGAKVNVKMPTMPKDSDMSITGGTAWDEYERQNLGNQHQKAKLAQIGINAAKLHAEEEISNLLANKPTSAVSKEEYDAVQPKFDELKELSDRIKNYNNTFDNAAENSNTKSGEYANLEISNSFIDQKLDKLLSGDKMLAQSNREQIKELMENKEVRQGYY